MIIKLRRKLNSFRYNNSRKAIWKLERLEGYTYSNMLDTQNAKWLGAYKKYTKAKARERG